MAMNDSFVTQVICEEEGASLGFEATELLRSRWAVAASAAQNEKEAAEYEKIADNIKYVVVQNGASVSFVLKIAEHVPFQEVIEEGMPAPLSGGNNGLVTEPNGDTHISNVPSQLWGTELTWYAKAPNPITEEANKMLATLAPDMIRAAVSACNGRITKEAASYFKSEILAALGGK